jgi:Tol biopolymer transport system component
MRKATLLVLTVLLLSGCTKENAPLKPADSPFVDRHMENVTQLTFEGDNGEAYFSPDDRKLIFQSSRGGYACDKIWVMNIDGSEKRRLSPDRGAHTCSFFFPDGQKIIFASTSHLPGDCPPSFASTSHLPGDCPPRPKLSRGAHFIWPLFPYDIFVAKADGSGLKKITDNPKYDAEPIVSADGKQIVFGSQRYGDFDIYIMNGRSSGGPGTRRLKRNWLCGVTAWKKTTLLVSLLTFGPWTLTAPTR